MTKDEENTLSLILRKIASAFVQPKNPGGAFVQPKNPGGAFVQPKNPGGAFVPAPADKKDCDSD